MPYLRSNIQLLNVSTFLLLFIVRLTSATNPVVKTGSGSIVGTILYLEDEQGSQKSVDAYLGIPYAQAPVGNLRFKPPVTSDTWKGELVATSVGNRCPQVYSAHLPVLGNYDEDCLNLDVYVPIPVPDKAAVMIWVHGGGFISGAGSMEIISPSPLAAFGDVIVVAINYRLGALGFLSTGDDQVVGNLGLLDQLEAMKWVQDNIDGFGGDPDRVTIFGESAGAACVSLHTLSPLSNGLFSRAIMQSGVGLSSLFISTEIRNNRNRAYELGKLVRCNNDTSKHLIQCLQSVSVEALVNASQIIHDMWPFSEEPNLPWAPVVDGYFLPTDPATLLHQGTFNKVDLLAGHNSHEGMLFLMAALKDPSEPYLDKTLFEAFLSYTKTNMVLTHPILRHAMDLVYTNYVDATENYANTIVQIHGDQAYICPTDAFLKAFDTMDTAGTRNYRYHMTHHPTMSVFNTPWSGACHADDLVFVFGAHFYPNSPFRLTPEEVRLSMGIMQFWTNFAKTGNPNIESESVKTSTLEDPVWPEFTISKPLYKDLSLDLSNGRALKTKECKLWNKYIPYLRRLAGYSCNQCQNGQGHQNEMKDEL